MENSTKQICLVIDKTQWSVQQRYNRVYKYKSLEKSLCNSYYKVNAISVVV